MVRKLFRTGRSLCVGLPEAAAATLGLTEGDYVEVDCDSEAGALLIWPRDVYDSRVPERAYLAAVAGFLRDYGPSLAALEAD
jgi:antitoxin component of MazEF toxin-antitoxin module